MHRGFIPQKTKPGQSPMQTPGETQQRVINKNVSSNQTGRATNVLNQRVGQQYSNFTSPDQNYNSGSHVVNAAARAALIKPIGSENQL